MGGGRSDVTEFNEWMDNIGRYYGVVASYGVDILCVKS